MDFNKKLKITTPRQFKTLLDLMWKNPNMAKGYHKNSEKTIIKEQWNDIKRKLNSIDPPIRETEGWMKVWADLKTSVKNKLVHNKAECRGTGGGPFRQKVLTQLEEAVAGLLQMDSIINSDGPTFSVQNVPVNLFEETHADDVNIEDNMDNIDLDCQSNSNSQSNVPSRKTKIHSKAVDKETLLQQQLKVQTDLYNDMKKTLLEIERYTRKTYKLQEEQLKIKKRKLMLYEEELKKKEMRKSAKLKLRIEEIDIKRRKIEIEESKHSYI